MPQVEEVLNLAADLLGDSERRRFTNEDLAGSFVLAYSEVVDLMILHGAPDIRLKATYTLPAGTAALTPATAGITNLGELILLEERPGSSSKYDEVHLVSQLPQDDPAPQLRVFENRAGSFFFIPATQDVQLQFTYYSDGNAPSTGEIGIPDCLAYAAYSTAIHGGPRKGLREEAMALQAKLEANDGPKDLFIRRIIHSLRNIRVQQGAFDLNDNRAAQSSVHPRFV